jgi:1-deoxyxylulose-5-phosphate synthase
MDYLRLGSSGLMMSRIGLAMMSHGDPGSQRWVRREDDAEPVIRHAAIDASPSRQHGMVIWDTW